jgi:peptide-methionine (S)-S-oxide reductase
MSIIFYHNDEQKQAALQSKELEESRLGRSIKTLIVPFSKFYLAEDYHQKYYLQQYDILKKEFNTIYPDARDFVNSTAAARVNGYAGGYGTLDTLQKELDSFGLSAAGSEKLLEIANRGLKPGICMD